jgi:hypothetical protein
LASGRAYETGVRHMLATPWHVSHGVRIPGQVAPGRDLPDGGHRAHRPEAGRRRVPAAPGRGRRSSLEAYLCSRRGRLPVDSPRRLFTMGLAAHRGRAGRPRRLTSTEHEHEATTTPTPSASSPAPGSTSSGTAGNKAPPTTPPGTTPAGRRGRPLGVVVDSARGGSRIAAPRVTSQEHSELPRCGRSPHGDGHAERAGPGVASGDRPLLSLSSRPRRRVRRRSRAYGPRQPVPGVRRESRPRRFRSSRG